MMEQNIDIEEAKARAKVRAEAPQQVAEAKGRFLENGQTRNPAGMISNAYSNQQNLQLGFANQFQNDANQANQDVGTGFRLIGQGLSQLPNIDKQTQPSSTINYNYNTPDILPT